MDVPQKSRYALRAIFELARRYGQGPVKIVDIAKAQATPPRFLEVILNQLKQGGFVGSKRGRDGGYVLLRPPGNLTVGEVLEFVQGPVRLVDCSTDRADACPLHANCVFLPMWQKVQDAITEVYDQTTFQYFLDQEQEGREKRAPSYSI